MADITVEVPGIGDVDFPDTMNDEQIAAAIRRSLHEEGPTGLSAEGRPIYSATATEMKGPPVPGMERMGGYPPPPARVALPSLEQRETEQLSRSMNVPGAQMPFGRDLLAEGLSNLSGGALTAWTEQNNPDPRTWLGGINRSLRGAMTLGTPAIPGGLVKAPLPLLTGIAAGETVPLLLKKLGLDETYAEAAGNYAAIVGGGAVDTLLHGGIPPEKVAAVRDTVMKLGNVGSFVAHPIEHTIGAVAEVAGRRARQGWEGIRPSAPPEPPPPVVGPTAEQATPVGPTIEQAAYQEPRTAAPPPARPVPSDYPRIKAWAAAQPEGVTLGMIQRQFGANYAEAAAFADALSKDGIPVVRQVKGLGELPIQPEPVEAAEPVAEEPATPAPSPAAAAAPATEPPLPDPLKRTELYRRGVDAMLARRRGASPEEVAAILRGEGQAAPATQPEAAPVAPAAPGPQPAPAEPAAAAPATPAAEPVATPAAERVQELSEQLRQATGAGEAEPGRPVSQPAPEISPKQDALAKHLVEAGANPDHVAELIPNTPANASFWVNAIESLNQATGGNRQGEWGTTYFTEPARANVVQRMRELTGQAKQPEAAAPAEPPAPARGTVEDLSAQLNAALGTKTPAEVAAEQASKEQVAFNLRSPQEIAMEEKASQEPGQALRDWQAQRAAREATSPIEQVRSLAQKLMQEGHSGDNLYRDLSPQQFDAAAKAAGIANPRADLLPRVADQMRAFERAAEPALGLEKEMAGKNGNGEPVNLKELFSNPDKAAADAEARIQKRGTLRKKTRGSFLAEEEGSQPSAEDMRDMAIWGASKIVKGVNDFGAWSRQLYDRFGSKFSGMTREGVDRLWTESRMLHADEQAGSEVSNRVPTAAKATENPLTDMLTSSMESVTREPERFQNSVDAMREYPGFKDIKTSVPIKAANIMISRIKDNLLALHDALPEAIRNRARMWYDGANRLAHRFAENYGVTPEQTAGVMAVLSPQKDWFMNVDLARRVMDVWKDRDTIEWKPQMDAIWQDKIYPAIESAKSRIKLAERFDQIKGKKLSEIEDPKQRALWVRVHDEAMAPREYQTVSPEGEFTGVFRKDEGRGDPANVAWGDYNTISKALSILDDGSRENIHNMLGEEHKVRNFYNNIINPNSRRGHVTIDTHAVAAGLWRALSGSSTEVSHNFGSSGGSAVSGESGTYGIFAEAYRQAAAERGLLPREMQSITWEAVRGLFDAPMKSESTMAELIEKVNKRVEKGKLTPKEGRAKIADIKAKGPTRLDQIDSLWKDVSAGKITPEAARARIQDIAGGIDTPAWFQ